MVVKVFLWRTASKHVYYQVWNRSPVQVGCMRQVLGAGALGWPRGMGWGGRWEEGSGWGTHVNPWLIHVNVWQKPLQYCKVIGLQLIKINGKKKYVPSLNLVWYKKLIEPGGENIMNIPSIFNGLTQTSYRSSTVAIPPLPKSKFGIFSQCSSAAKDGGWWQNMYVWNEC